jgi:cullin-associated NEDD8-dissociated protein 1
LTHRHTNSASPGQSPLSSSPYVHTSFHHKTLFHGIITTTTLFLCYHDDTYTTMSSRTSNLPPAHIVAELVNKLHDADSDIRYMSLSDLAAIFSNASQSAYLAQDYTACARVIDGLLHTLTDTNGEVQNQTIKCIGPLVQRVQPSILAPMILKFTSIPPTPSIDISIFALALRTLVVSLPRPAPGQPRSKAITESYDAISKVLIPRLIGYVVIPRREKDLPDPPRGLLVEDLEVGRDSNAIDVLTEVARCFGPLLQESEVQALQQMTLKVLENDRAGSAMKKKAVTALSTLSHFFSDGLLSAVVSHLIQSLRDDHLETGSRRLIITIFGSIARAIPAKFGTHLKTLAPFVLSAVSQTELDEQMEGADEDEERDPQADDVREAALTALEAFISSSPADMNRYMPECIDAVLRFIKYDPVVVDDEDDDEMEQDEEDFELDEDFEADVGADDEDDVSWKVRRVAAKALSTIVSVRGRELLDNGSLYDTIALALVARFREREESVRIEVLTTLGFLVRRTGENAVHGETSPANGVENALSLQPQSRKRRRAGSDVSMSDTRKSGRFTGSTSPEYFSPPPAGPAASLAKIGVDMTNGLIKLIMSSTPLTKQAALSVLKDLIVARHGGFDSLLPSILPPVVDTIESGGSGKSAGPVTSGGGSKSGATLQTEALQLLAEILKAHSSRLFQPHLPGIVRAVLKCVGDRSPRIAIEGLNTLEQLVKALTSPRSAGVSAKSSAQIDQILSAVLDVINSKNVDLSVRKEAIHVLGVLLSRTFGTQGSKVLAPQRRSAALDVLYAASQNETTRYTTIRAIDAMATSTSGDRVGFDVAWTRKLCLELAAQLRKADRALRGASLAALRTLIANSDGSPTLDSSSEEQLVGLLVPLLTSEDLHMIGPALVVLTSMVMNSQRNLAQTELVQHICALAKTPTAASVLAPLSGLVESIGKRGAGKDLMAQFLQDVGIKASPAVVGKLIGALVVSGGRSVGVKTDAFLKEVKSAPDDQRRNLALAVLGEIGLRSGAQAGLSPDLFIGHFAAKSPEVSLAAANALGRAAAGPDNVSSWVPAILTRIKQQPGEQYLGLHAIRELLQHNENDKEIMPFANTLWESALSASRQSEDNRALGAECIANLVMIDSPTYLTALQVSSHEQSK